MAGPSRDPGSSRHPLPGWVKMFVIIGLAVAVLVLVVVLMSGGRHGPGRHLPREDERGGHAPHPLVHAPADLRR